ncbi:type II secretion system major pseudopilin GspG [Planctomycetaceae bacterium SH139]
MNLVVSQIAVGSRFNIIGVLKRANRGNGRWVRGFTLIELLLVLAILLVLAGLVVPKLAGRQKSASIDATRISIEGLEQAIELYSIDHEGLAPSSAEGLGALTARPGKDPSWRGPYLADVPLDAWGEAFQYRMPGTHNRDGYDLVSAGPDHAFGTDDDIGNWK